MQIYKGKYIDMIGIYRYSTDFCSWPRIAKKILSENVSLLKLPDAI